MPEHLLPTLPQLLDYLIEEYGCTHERLTEPVEGGCIFHQLDHEKEPRKYPYVDKSLGPKGSDGPVAVYIIVRICGKLAIVADEVFDHFDRELATRSN